MRSHHGLKWLGLSFSLGLLLAFLGCQREAPGAAAQKSAGRNSNTNAVPVVAGTVETKDVPIYLDGLGTVQAFNTVLVRSRVDGQLEKIAFDEGQEVRAGDLLAQIDPAPFQAQVDQNVAKKAADEAQLSVARLNLQRAADLLKAKIMSQADYDTQKALVDQLQAAVQADQAAIDSARVQLAYTTIRSPIDGRTGIRLVDQGNIVHASDSNGIVVITQLRPISVVFTLPEQSVPEIQRHLGRSPLTTIAVDRENRTTLAEGKLAVIDNQIDTATGTIRLKSNFPNPDLRLWPGEFVNVRLLLDVRKGGVVVPASVVQRGPDGTFAYVIGNNMTAQLQPIKVAQVDQGLALIDSGLTPGERVVVDGQYKLQPGSRVSWSAASGGSPASPRNTAVRQPNNKGSAPM